MRTHLVKALVAAMAAAFNGFATGFSIGSPGGSWVVALVCGTGALAGVASCWININSALAEAPR